MNTVSSSIALAAAPRRTGENVLTFMTQVELPFVQGMSLAM